MQSFRKDSQNRSAPFWIFQGIGWVLFLYLIYAQVIPAFNYELGVAMGTQEPAELISEVGVAFWKGFAFADLIYVSLLGIGLVGQLRVPARRQILFASALGITIYWPVVCLVAVYYAGRVDAWELQNETAYWVVLPTIALWGVWGMWRLRRE